ncbi:PREDICTED: uncharacterized protein LOC109355968 isoform X1 [Lupinus angustifolius]|uniref:uncharacterized protein LOC109355968 isoform X1 n=1 Tax=Lupinus angustifolius TaxID=3871 RepID=UPI00092EE302|nr:PREDICTED: uncharacterized protein LOC109355968 isoform X1 [Lupinus angustifolius]
MADPHGTNSSGNRDLDLLQLSLPAIASLKKGAYLLKYGRRGKPKFCPFRLSNDESLLIWYSGKEEKQLKLSTVSMIIPGQRTAIFRRYPQPEKEYQSFSLIYNDRSLDVICKDKDEAEIWFVGLKALVTRCNNHRRGNEARFASVLSDSPQICSQRYTPSVKPVDPGDTIGFSFDNSLHNTSGKPFSEIISYPAAGKSSSPAESIANSSLPPGPVNNSNLNSSPEPFRESVSSAVSSFTSLSQGSYQEDFDALSDVYIWGEDIGNGVLGGGVHRVESLSNSEMDALIPKALKSKVVLDVYSIACGSKHAVVVTKQGEIFSWGYESGGRLGLGVEANVSHPKPIDTLSNVNIELVACGDYHTCAITFAGDLYTWGDGTHNSGLLGNGNEVSHWIPKKVSGDMEGVHISFVSCGPWHTAIVTLAGQLFTFGDGSFGALGHGDHSSTDIPREVEALKGLRTTWVSCGVWHTASVVQVINESMESSMHSLIGKLFAWGDGDEGRLGHVDKEPRLVPDCVTTLNNENICRVACGQNLTIALTTSGHVYTMGSAAYGQLGCPASDGKVPGRVEGELADSFVDDIACGSYHVAVLTSKAEVYTWGKGLNGQLGHGDIDHRDKPTLVPFLKDKQVKSVACGSNFTAVICLHKWISSADHSVCSACRNPFGFIRKRRNCYNCGLVFCIGCSSRKSTKASLAPDANKPFRVCDDCYSKLKKAEESISLVQTPTSRIMSANDTRATKLQASLSTLAPVGSIVQTANRYKNLPELHDNHVFSALNGKLRLGTPPRKASNSHFRTSRKRHSISVLPSRGASQSSSISPKSGTQQSCTDIHDNSKHMNDILSQEVICLRAQIEDLTHKSNCLEAELERTSKQLKQVTAVAADEADKYISAKELIKMLTAQLKEMVQVQRLLEGHNAESIADLYSKTTVNTLNQSVEKSHMTNTITPSNGSNSNAANRILPNGNKTQSGKAEWVVQDEPGVYVTLSSLPGDGNELKNVRFSRRHFTEEQAEKWWAENGTKVLERHNVVALLNFKQQSQTVSMTL